MPDQAVTVAELRQRVADFVDERAWNVFHDAKNLSMAITIEAAELMEHFQWARSDELDALLADPDRRQEIVDELADISCFALALANALKVDLSDAIVAKMAANAAKYPPDEFHGRYYKPK